MKRYERVPMDSESLLALVIVGIGALFWAGYTLMVAVGEVPELLRAL